MSFPRIGINCEFEAAAAGGRYELPHSYVRAVLRAGGVPVLIPNAPSRAAAARALDAVHAVIFSGGDDLHPRRWGETLHPRTKLLHPDKEASDYRLVNEALRRDMPLLGVCGGCQLLNVARGGSLIQHIPAALRDPLRHHVRKGRPRPVHRVDVAPGTLLHRVVRALRLEANSSHHQAVARPGRGLRVSARAPDGVIEAVEAPDRRFALGVQWHPERLPGRAVHRRLFEALVRAAKSK